MRQRYLAITGLAAGLVLAGVGVTSAQTTPILRTDIRAATFPNYGCDSWDRTFDGQYYSEQRIAGGSPSGNDSIRIRAIRSATPAQEDFGCFFASSLPPSPPQGTIRYARWRLRIHSPVNWRSDYPSPNQRAFPDKLFILGNGCESASFMPTRMIFSISAGAPGRNVPAARFTQNIGPGIPYYNIPVDTWLNYQVKIVSSSTESALDGQVYIYQNNNQEASPTRSASGIQIRTTGWGRSTGCGNSSLIFGEGSWSSLSAADPTSNADYELADFEYDDQFDPNWAIGIPTAPTNLRVIPGSVASTLLMLPIGVVGLSLLTRRKLRE